MSLTPSDFKIIEHIMETKVEESVKRHVGNLPTRDEFYDKMDLLIKEVREYRQERVFLNDIVTDTTRRIEKLEGIISA